MTFWNHQSGGYLWTLAYCGVIPMHNTHQISINTNLPLSIMICFSADQLFPRPGASCYLPLLWTLSRKVSIKLTGRPFGGYWQLLKMTLMRFYTSQNKGHMLRIIKSYSEEKQWQAWVKKQGGGREGRAYEEDRLTPSPYSEHFRLLPPWKATVMLKG